MTNQVLRLTHSFRDIIKLLIEQPEGMTKNEIADRLGYNEYEKILPRLNELEKVGLIYTYARRFCKITGEVSRIWLKV